MLPSGDVSRRIEPNGPYDVGHNYGPWKVNPAGRMLAETVNVERERRVLPPGANLSEW